LIIIDKVNIMALNNSREAIIAQRRRHVASLAARQLTQREIVASLEKLGCVNERPGKDPKPWDLATVNHDLKALRQEWRELAQQDTATLQAQRLAELSEVKRRAWADEDLGIVLRAIKQEAEMLGLDAPQKVAPTDPTGKDPYQGLSDEERVAKILALLERARARQARHGAT
jgi:hypothetical protein